MLRNVIRGLGLRFSELKIFVKASANMIKVEVDIADLETLVFATAAIKAIESALQLRLNDPFVKPHLDFTEAHNRLTGAMNQARRATLQTAINWDEPLTSKELDFLYDLSKRKEGLRVGISGSARIEESAIDSLAAKGCIRIGQEIIGAIWAGETRPDIKPLPSFSVMLTARGRQKFENSRKAQTGMKLVGDK